MYTLAENEKVVKTYSCTSGKKLGIPITTDVTVTTKRVIWAKKGVNAGYSVDLYRDYKIDSITGFDSTRLLSRNIMLTILGVLLALGAFVQMIQFIVYAVEWETFVAWLFFLILFMGAAAAGLIYWGLKPRSIMLLEMYLKHSRNRAFSVFGGEGIKFRDSNGIKIKIKKGMEDMLFEIPALVLDIQQDAEAAFVKWSGKDSNKNNQFRTVMSAEVPPPVQRTTYTPPPQRTSVSTPPPQQAATDWRGVPVQSSNDWRTSSDDNDNNA